MKKIMQKSVLLIAFIAAGINYSPAQNILSVTITPPNPTSNDPITVLANSQFSSGTCYSYTTGSYVTGNNVVTYATHCLGMLSVICYDMDTFIIPPLAPGNYILTFHLESGQLPSCTPGIVPGPTDTVLFTVAVATGINESGEPTSFSITPNPFRGNLMVRINPSLLNGKCILELINISGKTLKQFTLTETNSKIQVDLPSGIYFCRVNRSAELKKIIILPAE